MTALSRQAFESNPYTYLNNFIKQWGNSEVRAVAALMVKLTGNKSAARMFDRLLKLFKHSKNPKGVYKTYRDWQAELAISRSTSSRVHQNGSLKKAGIRHQIAQVAGRGTPMFYRLDFKGLLRALAKLAGVGVMTVRAWMMGEESPEKKRKPTPKKPSRLPHFDNSGCVKGAQANNKDSQEDLQENTAVVSEAIRETPEIEEGTAKKLIRKHGVEAFRRAVSYVRRMKPSNFGGYLTQALRNHWYDAQGASWRTYNSGTDWQAVAAEHGLVGRKNPFEGMSFSQFAAKGGDASPLPYPPERF